MQINMDCQQCGDSYCRGMTGMAEQYQKGVCLERNGEFLSADNYYDRGYALWFLTIAHQRACTADQAAFFKQQIQNRV
jgi:hypothetical protein